MDFSRLWWLLEVEAAMKIHRRVYPTDGRWRRWIRTQALDLSPEWYERLRRHARAVIAGQATRFIDPEDELTAAPDGGRGR